MHSYAKTIDKCEHQGLMERTEKEFERNPERVHNVRSTTNKRTRVSEKRLSTICQPTSNVLCILSVCALQLVCVTKTITWHKTKS